MANRDVIETFCYRYGRNYELRHRAIVGSDKYHEYDKTCLGVYNDLKSFGAMDDNGNIKETYLWAFDKGRDSVGEY